MVKMAKNGPKWLKFGPNTYIFDILKLGMSQNGVDSDTDYPGTIVKKYRVFNCD